MAKGFKHGAGGGGSGGLNFFVVAYATEDELTAATPKENTIGVITSDAITSWVFSATEPEAPLEGMVWISTGTSSPVEFNALKKNGIQAYPISAKQYVGGSMVEKTAKSYQGSAWVEWWDGTLFDNGDQYESITGGWAGDVSTDISVTGTGTYANAHTQNAIDLTGKTKLYATVSEVTNKVSSGSFSVGLMLLATKPASTSADINAYGSSSVGSAATHTATTLEIDISTINIEVYIVCTGHASGGAGKFSKIWLE